METIIEQDDIKELKRVAKQSKLKSILIRMSLYCALVIIIAFCALLCGRRMAEKSAAAAIAELNSIIEEKDEQYQDLIENPILVTPITPKIELDVINSEIREIGELATVEYLFTDAAKFSDSKQIKDWNIPFTEKSFILKWDGVIKAGVTVDQITVSINDESKTIIVSMPAASILSYSIESENVSVLDEQNNVFNPITITDKIKMDAKTENAMKERAIENGLLEKAQKNAENVITNLLKANPAITDAYEITFIKS